ncbi:MAG: copper-binding protein [Pelagibacterales bacterium]|nr:copper-binding protein [Pelagibacterales bacterium]PPR15068.1 MAG: hypothetical protein CFH33_01658 [Alphaproteobacteria bacterium MarineAlpha9_Bin3]|tara:strand:+ start:24528 stop:25151 length:624 start_codon:yes stop_codon:yes gene_type:complete
MKSPFLIGIKRGIVLSLLLVIFWLVLDFFYFSKLNNQNKVNLESQQPAAIGGKFILAGEGGKLYSNDSFQGKPLLIFFGFASCPDICPYGLTMISSVLDEMGEESQKVNAVFVSLDPERDDYKKVTEFANIFHEEIIGLSGSQEQVDKIALAWRVYKKKVLLEGSDLGYTIDHSSFIYLMDKNGKYYTHFPHNVDAEEILIELDKLI